MFEGFSSPSSTGAVLLALETEIVRKTGSYLDGELALREVSDALLGLEENAGLVLG